MNRKDSKAIIAGRSSTDPIYFQTAVLLLLASIFAFIRSVWYLAGAVIWAIPQQSGELYVNIISAVFEFVFLYLTLIFIFVAGTKKVGGLVSSFLVRE